MTFTIPEFLVNGHYWAGFFTSTIILVALFLYGLSKIRIF